MHAKDPKFLTPKLESPGECRGPRVNVCLSFSWEEIVD
jgi:hypothetical protein